MSIREECGVFGVISPKPADVAGLAYYGLYSLQHRGQESCGIVVNDDGVFTSHKDLGLVGEVFSSEVLSSFPKGTMALGHTRYGTTGAASRSNCQPIEVNHQKGRMALAHNGNLSNAFDLRSRLELSGAIFHTSSDTEIIAYIVTQERLRTSSIEEAVSRAMYTLEGAYSLIVMSPQKMICARDPFGFRPLSYGQTPDGTYIVASESCALDAVGAELLVAPQSRADGPLVCGYSLYVGPRKMSELRKEGRDHLAVMRFGTWSFFCRHLLDLLNAIHAVIPSYGLAIIILTVLVRLVLYPFTRKSMDSMKKMQELQPKVKELQKKYKDDKRKLQQEQMRLYAEAKVNPLSSCLPMLVQLPVFIALFMVLRTSVELRHESFLWIRDLSEPENLFRDTLGFGLNLLPIGMAVTMTLQSRLTPTAGDPSQQKMMTVLMPIMMLVMCYPFASALGLYWVVSQAIAIAAILRARRKGRPASFTQPDGTEVIPPERETRQMRRDRERRAEKQV